MKRQNLQIKINNNITDFFINDSLQFNSVDEHIYHESLVLPGAELISNRKNDFFKALILGGGDGLALKQLLKFEKLHSIHLVDIDENVIKLAKTKFNTINNNALNNNKLRIFIQDAFEFLKLQNNKYDLIISDLTYPDNIDTAKFFTNNFFDLIKSNLNEEGLFSSNAVSPENTSIAYWSIFNTLKNCNLNPIPLNINIPSFKAQGYGQWGFFMGSITKIRNREINDLNFKYDTQFLNKKTFLDSIISSNKSLTGKIIIEPADLLCLLRLNNTNFNLKVSFNELQTEWSKYVLNILNSIDFQKFINTASIMNSKIKGELLELMNAIKNKKFISFENCFKSYAALMISIFLINMSLPDNAYAKGYSSYHSGSGGSDIEFVFFSKTNPMPFHGELFSQPNNSNFIPDMKGNKKNISNILVFTESSKDENLFYALTDDIYLNEQGTAFYVLKNLTYVLKIQTNKFILIDTTLHKEIYSFYPDIEILQSLYQNLNLQLKSINSARDSLIKWLNWSSCMKIASSEISNEVNELNKMERIIITFNKSITNYKNTLPKNSKISENYKLFPGIYLKNFNSILIHSVSGELVTYKFNKYNNAENYHVLESNNEFDKFLTLLIEQKNKNANTTIKY